jgi:hypothetical protein
MEVNLGPTLNRFHPLKSSDWGGLYHVKNPHSTSRSLFARRTGQRVVDSTFELEGRLVAALAANALGSSMWNWDPLCLVLWSILLKDSPWLIPILIFEYRTPLSHTPEPESIMTVSQLWSCVSSSQFRIYLQTLHNSDQNTMDTYPMELTISTAE